MKEGLAVLFNEIKFQDWRPIKGDFVYDSSYDRCLIMADERGLKTLGTTDGSHFTRIFKKEDIEKILEDYEDRWGKPNSKAPSYFR